METALAKPGLSVKFRFSFFVLVAILAFERMDNPLLLGQWLVVVTLSVLAHELGHALTYRWFGHGSRIVLHGMGGLTQSTDGPRLSHLQQAAVSVAGPFAGFGISLIVIGVAKFVTIPERLLFDLLWVNVGWSVINLLPIVPMDGGHILQNVLRHKMGAKAEVPALAVSLGVALVCGIAAYISGWTWSLVMVAWFASSNVQALIEHKRHARLESVRVAMRQAVEAYYAGDLGRAGELAIKSLGETNDTEAKAQIRPFLLALETAASSGKHPPDDPKLAALRASPDWTAAIALVRAAQTHDHTKIFK